MKSTVQKWGNSLAFRIPKSYAEETHISEGTEIEVTMKSGALVLRPILKRRYTLTKLLEGITPANQHKEVQSGPAVGKEVW